MAPTGSWTTLFGMLPFPSRRSLLVPGGVLLLATAQACTCGSPDAEVSARRGVEGTAAPAPPPVAPPPSDRGEPAWRTDRAPGDQPPPPPAATEEVALDEDDARDLEAELAEAFGTPRGCFTPEEMAEHEGTVEIQVTVYVVTTGSVTRAEVVAPGFLATTVDCLEKRAEGLRFEAPVPEAPRRIRTAIPFRFSVDSTLEAKRIPPNLRSPFGQSPESDLPRLPPGAVAPALVLPAQVGDGPAPGSVPPATTLPAQVDDGRPPGFVPPTSTLPAQVD